MLFRSVKRSLTLKYRIFTALLLSIALTLLVLSTVLFSVFVHLATRQVTAANMHSLDQVATEVSIMADVTVTISNQLFQDVAVSKLQYFRQPDIYDLTNALRQMSNYRMSIPFIDSIYVYNRATGNVYTEAGAGGAFQSVSEGFADKQAMDIIQNYRDYKPYKPIPRKYVYASGTEIYYYTFLMYDVLQQDALGSAIMVNISDSWMKRVIRQDAESSQAETLVADGQGMLVSDAPGYPIFSDLSGRPWMHQVLKEKTGGHQVAEVDGVKSLVVYTRPDAYGWRYIRVLPWDTLFSSIEHLRTVTILISLGILVAGMLVSLFVTGRLYLPVGRILLNMERLERERHKQGKLLRDEMIRGLLAGRDREESGKTEGSPLPEDTFLLKPGVRRGMILFTVDDYRGFQQRFPHEDRELYRFAILNIASELLTDLAPAVPVDMCRDGGVVILNLSGCGEGVLTRERTAECIREIQQAVRRHLELSVTATVHLPEQGGTSLHQQYNEVTEASLYRMFHGPAGILWAQDTMGYTAPENVYPIEQEKEMTEAVLAGRIQEARHICTGIIRNTFTQPYSVFLLTVSHLKFALSHQVTTVLSRNPVYGRMAFSSHDFMQNDAEYAADILLQFDQLFDSLEACLAERKSQRHDAVAARINQLIAEKYGDCTLSVDSLADEVGMSPSYVSRIYKQLTMHSILDEIVSVRMSRARELLESTTLPIEDIAEKAGFSNSSYFYRSFRTVHGETPGEYRSRCLLGGS